MAIPTSRSHDPRIVRPEANDADAQSQSMASGDLTITLSRVGSFRAGRHGDLDAHSQAFDIAGGNPDSCCGKFISSIPHQILPSGYVSKSGGDRGPCNVSKVYDQVGGTSGWVNTATASQQPRLLFTALNSLPGTSCTAAASSQLNTTTTFAPSQPYTFTGAYEWTANFATDQWILGVNNIAIGLRAPNTTNTAAVQSITPLSQVATDSAFHAISGLASSSGVINVDGVENTGTTGIQPWTSNTLRWCRGFGFGSRDGTVMELGVWFAGFTSTQRANVNSNLHGTNGYNF